MRRNGTLNLSKFFLHLQVDCLTGLFQNLPKEMESADIANIVAKWGLVSQ